MCIKNRCRPTVQRGYVRRSVCVIVDVGCHERALSSELVGGAMTEYVEHVEANEHINLIASLLAKGHSDQAVADQLIAGHHSNLSSADGVWSAEGVRKIRIDFGLTPIRRADIEKGTMGTTVRCRLHNLAPTR